MNSKDTTNKVKGARASGVKNVSAFPVFNRPRIMAIVNVTPDSFFLPEPFVSNGKLNKDALLEHVGGLLDSGADLLDLGGQSTRPGAEFIGAAEEMERVVPAIAAVREAFGDATISVDTFQPL